MPASALPGIMEPIFYLLPLCESVRKVGLFRSVAEAEHLGMQTNYCYRQTSARVNKSGLH